MVLLLLGVVFLVLLDCVMAVASSLQVLLLHPLCTA